MIQNLFKPKLEAVPLAVGLRWRGGNSSGFMFQEKSDGCHEFAELAGAVVNAERMASGEIVVNDILTLPGQDVRREPTRTRWAILGDWWRQYGGARQSFATGHPWRLAVVGQGGEFLEHLLRAGGEGVVAKPLEAPFGANWFKCKRCQVFLCVVTALDHARGSVSLTDAATGQERGKLPLRGKFSQVRVGSILKVEAFGLTTRGLLREARPDRDTETSWLVKF